MRRILSLLILLCVLGTVSCAPAPAQQGWAYKDLRLLDPAGDAPVPATDLLAVYTRTRGSDLEIRLDLLDLTFTDDTVIAITLGDDAAFSKTPLELTIPAQGAPSADAAGIRPRVVRDPWLDTVIVRLNRASVGKRYWFSLTTSTTQSAQVADRTAAVRSDGKPPAERAPLVLAFWNTYPAATPAQALRRWDGAHSGPRGERHGLKSIVDNAEAYAIPVALLDLKTPASLAALDFMDLKSQIKNLAAQRLLLLPDVAYAEPAETSLDFSRRAAAGFGLSASQFVYNASGRFQPETLAQFYPLEDATHLARSSTTRLIPLPAAEAIQATPDGPSLEIRKALMDAALSADRFDLMVLGGDLTRSTWGNADMAGPTFAWIAAHPWIHPLSGEELLDFPVKENITPPVPAAAASSLLDALQSAPNNSITRSAWQTYFTLTAPTTDELLQALRANYLGQVSELLAAARWAEKPYENIDCGQDLNGDGRNECLLASMKFFAILDPDGARLSNLFYVDSSGPHQLVAPSSQFTVGLSDPSEWKLDLGEAADPSAIPGAFSNYILGYVPQIAPADRSVTFVDPQRNQSKTYRLTNTGIEIEYTDAGSVIARIPLAADPQAFYFGPTSYMYELTPNQWEWGLKKGIQVKVRTDASLSAASFTDSASFLSLPEDPDQSYPAGHYLPFPLSVISLSGYGNFSVEINIK